MNMGFISDWLSLVLSVAKCFGGNGKTCLDQPPDYGWGEKTRWRKLGHGLKEARITGRPLMVIVYKSGCPSCNALKPKIADSEEVYELSYHFVMVNLGTTADCCWEIREATYVPRVMFLTPEGRLAREYYNKMGNPNYKYYYPSCGCLVDTMKEVLQRYPPGGGQRLEAG